MAQLPTQAEVKRAILDAIGTYNIRPGEIFPLMGVNVKVQQAGFRADEIAATLEVMFDEGLVEEANPRSFLKITEKGFAAI